jgi:hypothetical protein
MTLYNTYITNLVATNVHQSSGGNRGRFSDNYCKCIWKKLTISELHLNSKSDRSVAIPQECELRLIQKDDAYFCNFTEAE